jgi:hypothetical protein
MTEFETALQDCLRDLEQGNSNVDECLHRYPNYAQQLEPVLLTSAYLQRGREARPSAAFKARVRTKLIQQMYARPRKPARTGFMFMRLVGSLAVVILSLLAVGTAYAQSALPGNPFYGWKLASENVWRSVSPDPIGTDLAIAERRLNELIAVNQDTALSSQALKAYLAVVHRLKSEVNAENQTRILEILASQAEELNRSGIPLPPTDQNIAPVVEPTLIPISTPAVTPLPILETPQVNLTDVPQIIPTVEVPPQIVPTVRVPSQPIPTIKVPSGIVPTVQDPPKIIPTLEIPPPIP